MSTLRVDSIQDTTGVDNQGKIIQVVNSTANVAQFQTTATSFANTGFSVSITPKFASSKIRIDVSAIVLATAHYVYLDIYKDATTSLSGDATNGFSSAVAYTTTYWQNAGFFVFDSPNTTSSVTYNLFAKTVSGTIYIGTTNTTYPNAVYLSATEIAQ